MPNALQITDPNADNPLAQAPSWADAYGSVTGSTQNPISDLQQWLAAQRAKSAKMGLWNDQAGLPTGKGLVSAAQQTGNALLMGSTAPGIRAFHGSPYDFERFDASKIGTGEGAQAYGHGLYFAEREGTATGYRDDLAQKTYQTATGPEPYSNVWSALYHSQVGVHPNIAGPVATNVRNMIDESGSIDKALEQFDMPNDPKYAGAYQQAIDAARRMRLSTNPGSMYEVNIGADPEQFLHWDKPLSEQHPDVQKAIGYQPRPSYEDQAALLARLHDQGVPPEQIANHPDYKAMEARLDRSNVLENGAPVTPETPGSAIYHAFGKGDPASAAQALQQAGIPGIRYLDQGSRNAGGWHITPPDQTVSGKWMVKSNDYNSQGMHFDNEADARAALEQKIGGQTHNYVVFDANTIDILRKYGLAGLGVGLSGAAAGTQGQPLQ